MHTLTTKIKHSNKIVDILLDGGSTHSVVDKHTAKLLHSKVLLNKVKLEIETVNGETIYESQLVTFILPAGNKEIKIKAYVVDKLMEFDSTKSIDTLKIMWPNLNKEIVQDVVKNSFAGRIGLIVGQDNYWSFGLSQVIPHANESLGIIKTKLGWSMAGNMAKPDSASWHQYDQIKLNASKKIVNVQNQDEIRKIETSLNKLFDREEEIKDENNYSYEENYAMENFYKNIKVTKDGRYSIAPMFKEDAKPLRNNYFLALMRYRNLRRSLNNKPLKKKAYNEALKCMLENEEIEEVLENSASSKNMDIFVNYIPHSAVTKQERVTTSTRIVFDASSKNSEGISLNDQLLKGPKKQIDLIALLMKFRMKPIILIADISRMFYNIEIQEEFRDYYRLLWNFEDTDEPPKVYRFKRVLIGANDSPCIAISVVHHHLEKIAKEKPHLSNLCKLIKNNLYVDDLVISLKTEDEAIKMRREISEIFKSMKMKIRKWASNSTKVLQTIPKEDLYPYETMQGSLEEENQNEYINFNEENIIYKATKCL